MPKTIMVIDDDVEIHKLVEMFLAPMDCRIESAYDGREALSALMRLAPDLVLVDLNMPKMDGWELIRKMREEGALAETPVVVLTGRSGFLDKKVMASLAKVDAYVTKPFRGTELRAVVRGLLLETVATDRD